MMLRFFKGQPIEFLNNINMRIQLFDNDTQRSKYKERN